VSTNRVLETFMSFLPRSLPIAALLLVASAPEICTAADDTPHPLTANVTLASQYISRGIRQSWDRPALQGGVDYVRPDGWSAGAWASTVDDRFVENGRLELDLYGGYAGATGSLGYNVSAIYYVYPGAKIAATGTRFDYGELSGGLNWKSLYAKYNVTWTRDFFGIADARGTGYLDVGVNHELGHALTLNLHAGDGRVAGRGNAVWNWRDLRAGLSTKLDGGWIAAANITRAYGATAAYERYTTGVPRADGRPAVANVARRALVLSLTRTF
jgi:uncharacterized protein (TIGR02001 family)